MANVLKMTKIQALIELLKLGWSQRKISRELSINRETVSKYSHSQQFEDSKPAIVHAGASGRKSQCESYKSIIEEKLEKELTSQRIWQDLKEEHGYKGAYDSVKRFIKKLSSKNSLHFRRMECNPGDEVQVDFGTGCWIIEGNKKRRTHVFRMTLSYSRKSYSECIFHQTTESFIRCLENAFYYFGGISRTVVLDNLKAAVKHADWYDPELNRKVLDFSKHMGFVFLPTKPYMPRHKGKVESSVKYVKNNALKGRTFASIAEVNQFLQKWESNIADTRIHGTTKEQVQKRFIREKHSLISLPLERFPDYQEAFRSVHRDCHVEVARSYYSVPPEYYGHKVFVRWDAKIIRIYNKSFKLITVHSRVNPGRFNTLHSHISDKKISSVERGTEYLIAKLSKIGFWVKQWSETMIAERGIEGVRVLQGLLSLSNKHSSTLINNACRIFYESNMFRLRPLREWMSRNKNQEEFVFMKEHPLIRPLSEYQNIINVSFKKEGEACETRTN